MQCCHLHLCCRAQLKCSHYLTQKSVELNTVSHLSLAFKAFYQLVFFGLISHFRTPCALATLDTCPTLNTLVSQLLWHLILSWVLCPEYPSFPSSLWKILSILQRHRTCHYFLKISWILPSPFLTKLKMWSPASSFSSSFVSYIFSSCPFPLFILSLSPSYQCSGPECFIYYVELMVTDYFEFLLCIRPVP